MGKASEACRAVAIHHVFALLVVALLIYGLDAGSLVKESESAITGMTVVDSPERGVLIISDNQEFYQRMLGQYPITLSSFVDERGTVFVLDGSHDEVLRCLLEVAGQAQHRGDLVSYSLNLEPEE